ncbi:hypothetical protein EHQ61_19580 [Leptospira wolffii]|uniref:hypothetical protein n=1 Tax=Leptospira wolffii TaxID=409998 RepID=UPI0010823410|nr:hypothetical protein [Leptospira wolffii]TGL44060.1 hypothetical protein EHQ61_19580 [Leptospira wolffii]
MLRSYILRLNRSILLIGSVGLFFLSCGSQQGSANKDLLLALAASGQNDKIGESLSSAFDSVSSSMEGLSGEGASVALYGEESGLTERLASSLQRFWLKGPDTGLEAYDFSFDCWGGGDYQRQVVSTGATNYDFIDYVIDHARSPSSSFYASKTFDHCRFLPFTSWVIDGKTENIWSGLSSSQPFVQSGSSLQIGVDRTLENSSRGRKIQVTGTGATLSYGAGSPSTQQAYSLTWTGVSSGISFYSQDVSVLRVGYSGADLVYSHSVTSPSSLQYGVDRSSSNPLSWYRLWGGGSLQVVHTGAENFTLVTTVDSPVKWKYVDCLPSSGQVSFTLSGDLTGTGVVNFQNGVGNYSYTYTDADGNSKSSSGSVDFSSCGVPLVVL